VSRICCHNVSLAKDEQLLLERRKAGYLHDMFGALIT